MTLRPGDVILTGTPPGVGVFRKPPEYLKVLFVKHPVNNNPFFQSCPSRDKTSLLIQSIER